MSSQLSQFINEHDALHQKLNAALNEVDPFLKQILLAQVFIECGETLLNDSAEEAMEGSQLPIEVYQLAKRAVRTAKSICQTVADESTQHSYFNENQKSTFWSLSPFSLSPVSSDAEEEETNLCASSPCASIAP